MAENEKKIIKKASENKAIAIALSLFDTEYKKAINSGNKTAAERVLAKRDSYVKSREADGFDFSDIDFTKEISKQIDMDQIKQESTSLFKAGIDNPSTVDNFNLKGFNFGIKPGNKGDFGIGVDDFFTKQNKKLEQEPQAGITMAPKGKSDYEKSIEQGESLNTAIELGKLGANVSSYLSNERTKPPEPLTSKASPLLKANYVAPDTSGIDKDFTATLDMLRSLGGNAGSTNSLLRSSLGARESLIGKTNLMNMQERSRVDAANVKIAAKDKATNLSLEQYNRNMDAQLGAMKSKAQTSLMNAMFSNVTNIAAGKQRANVSKEEYKRYLDDLKIKQQSSMFGSFG